jgi:hypothetical protein
MARKLNLKKLVQANPLVNAQELDEGLALIRTLKRCGVKRSSYNLEPPFARRARPLAGSKEDPRTAHIGRR